MRLNKFLAQNGVESRRNCDDIIFQGRVTVDGETVTHPGTQIDEIRSLITVDGEKIKNKKSFTYIKLNKPQGYITSKKDPHNNLTVMKLIPSVLHAVPVGRLDKDSTGILIFTDDGDLNYKLTHPGYGVEKEYEIILSRAPEGFPEKDLPQGIILNDNGDHVIGKAYPVNKKRDHYKVILKEGKKREVKRIFRNYNCSVRRLHRNFFAGITANDLRPGKWKKLSPAEIKQLQSSVSQSRD